MKRSLMVIFCLLLISHGWSQETEIRATIDRMFKGLAKGDTTMLRTCFIPGVSFMTYSFDSKGNPKSKGENLTDFLRRAALTGESDMEERLMSWQCLIDDGIASVWTPYEFYFEGKFSHCGVNSFQLIKVQGEWRISMISDTRRKVACPSDQETIAVLDSLINLWHYDASIANETDFFGRMAEDGVYIGTDASERWKRDELKAWSKKYFDTSSAWDFKPISRNIRLAPGGVIAWFDELLDTWMGTCRSTGIMMKTNGDWKIVHYQLAITLPNDKIEGFKQLIGKQ